MANHGIQLTPEDHPPLLVLLLVREHLFDEAREVVDPLLLRGPAESLEERARNQPDTTGRRPGRRWGFS